MKFAMMIGAAALAFLAPVAASATDIDTTAGATSSINPFGSPNTATYGQTFTVDAGDTFINSFSMFLNGTSSALKFRGYLATWDGLKAGTLLYSSTDRLLNSPAPYQEYVFAPQVAVTPGSRYIAFLSVSEVGAQNSVTTTMPYSTADLLPNGAFVFQNNGTNFASLFGTNWAVYGGDVALKVDFGAGAVPEPASWAMMIVGVGAIGGTMRRRRSSTARVAFA